MSMLDINAFLQYPHSVIKHGIIFYSSVIIHCFLYFMHNKGHVQEVFFSFLTFIVHGNKQFWSLVINIKHVWLLFVISTKLKIVWGAPAIFTSWYRKLEKIHVWLNLSSYISVTKFIMVPNIIISLINM
jgi:hypothetical protein